MPLNNPPQQTNNQELYAVLNVAPDATDDEIKRSYRQLATIYHPDKAQDPEIRDDATHMFKRVQEAYEILSNKEKRDIYDVYGTEGLSSGMELSDPLKSREELRKEWEAFREKQKQQNVDAQVNHRGVYVFRVDASALAAPYSHDVPRTPEISNVYMTTGVDVPIEASKDWGPFASERDVIHLGGLVSVRKEVGGGSFLAGYKRVYQDYSTLELHAAAGLKSMVSIQSTVQLSQQSSASLISTWQPKSGLGLQFVTSRQLSEKYSGEVSWVLGPADSAGVSLGINRRTEKTALSARVDVGVATGIALRAVRQLNDVLNARAAVKFGTHGIELDIGGNKRMSELSTAGLSVVVGIQGVLLRFRYNRAGHLFEFPFFLSSTFDPRILAGAYILPPLCIYLATNCVIAPVQKAIESKRAKRARLAQATQIHQALNEAKAAATLMQGVAKRRLQKEMSVQGLVVVLALYGEESVVKEESVRRLQAAAGVSLATTNNIIGSSNNANNESEERSSPAAAVKQTSKNAPTKPKSSSSSTSLEHPLTDLDNNNTAAATGTSSTTPSKPSNGSGSSSTDAETPQYTTHSTSKTGHAPQSLDTKTTKNSSKDEQEPNNSRSEIQDGEEETTTEEEQTKESKQEEEELPPALVDVTTAMQYMCEHSKISLHKGYTKSALMGFCDPSPGSFKILQVYYMYKGRPYSARIGDAEGAVLPGRGSLLTSTEEGKLVEQVLVLMKKK